MTSKQLSDLRKKKNQILTDNVWRLSLHNIAKKLNHYHSSTDVFHKNKKLEMIIKKKVAAARKRPFYLKIQKLLEQ